MLFSVPSVCLAAVVAFPKEGQPLPFVSRCYLSGAVEPGVTNVVVRGRNVAVHPQGGWVTMVDVVPGTNVFEVGGVTRTFTVAKRPAKSAAAASERKYAKLAYAGDEPKAWPTGAEARDAIIVLDPGHGGRETGAVSPHNLPEKDLNLLFAKEVRGELVRRGYRVVMTREDDRTMPLYDRPKVAHAHDAAVFVSIHHNAPPLDRDPRTLRYHAVYAWNAIGEKLAHAINGRMAAVYGSSLVNNGVIHANFAVTRNPEIPSCLVEVDFITTPEEETDCWNPSRRRPVAASVAAGIADVLQ